MTVVEEILSKKVGRRVSAGDQVVVNVDGVMSHDSSTPLAIESFNKFEERVIPRSVLDKITVVFDHVYPSPQERYSTFQKHVREFCKQHGIRLYEGEGVCHSVMIEKGHVKKGDFIVGGDSHTPIYGVKGAIGVGMGSTDVSACWRLGNTWIELPEGLLITLSGDLARGVYPKDVALAYVRELTCKGGIGKALEFAGPFTEKLSVEERMPIGALATEASAVTDVFLESGSKSGSGYTEKMEIDVGELEPLVACPHNVDNVKPVTEVAGRKVDQVFVGSCANGMVCDLAVVAKILKGRKVHSGTRMIIIPATRSIYAEAYKKGYLETFMKSGAVVCWPSCGPCLGRFEGVLSAGEVCVSTSNRNFRGRMGSPEAEIYLASPATAAASAIEGRITDPRDYL